MPPLMPVSDMPVFNSADSLRKSAACASGDVMHSTDISAVKHLFMFFRQIYTLAGEKYADYKKRNLFFSVSLFYKINFSLLKIFFFA